MFSKILEKLFGSSSPFSLSSSPQAPKTFAQKKRSIFFNRYAGVVYFLICWHFFGSVVLSAAKEKAKKDGTDPYQTIGSKNARRIEIKDFNIRVLPSEAEKKESIENPKN